MKKKYCKHEYTASLAAELWLAAQWLFTRMFVQKVVGSTVMWTSQLESYFAYVCFVKTPFFAIRNHVQIA